MICRLRRRSDSAEVTAGSGAAPPPLSDAMLLRALLVACVLCRPSHCGPAASTGGPSYGSSHESDSSPSPPAAAADTPPLTDPPSPGEAPDEVAEDEVTDEHRTSSDEVADELTRLFESSFRPTPAPPPELLWARKLDELTSTLRQVQSGMLTLVERLDAMHVSQESMRHSQRELTSRLDAMQETQETLHSRLDDMQQESLTHALRLESMKEYLVKASDNVDVMQNSVDGVPKLASDMFEATRMLSAQIDAIVASADVPSGGHIGALFDSQTAESAQLASLSASQAVQSEQLAGARRSISGITGRMDALLRLPITGGGGAAYGGPLTAGGPALGSPCSADYQCSGLVSHSVCGDDQSCVCRDGFRRVSDRLCSKLPELGDPCSEDSDCLALTDNSRCSSADQCACQTGFSSRNGTGCWPSLVRGDACSDQRQCQLGLHCVDEVCSCPVADHGWYQYRLAGGPDCLRGRVEVRTRQSEPPHRPWRVVCDDYWDATDATVFCHSLGFNSHDGEIIKDGPFGRSTDFAMDDVRCTGSETHLFQCEYKDRHNCEATELAAVRCRE